jgi:hypothetical protein
MKTLNDHTILYDKECPICDFYTSAFINTGMLDQNGRVAFTDADALIKRYHVNRETACDRIALVDLKTGKVKYGIQSLICIVCYRFPFLVGLFNLGLVQFLAGCLYSFISFNRKVIIPGKDIDDVNACKPSFSFRYRVLYITLTWFLTSIILARYASHLTPFIPATNFSREFLICGGQILFQSVVILIINRKRYFDYIGNMMTISFAGSLLLLIPLALTSVINNPLIYAGWFMSVVCIMFFEHIRRTSLLKVSWILTLSWVLYRVIVLTLIV